MGICVHKIPLDPLRSLGRRKDRGGVGTSVGILRGYRHVGGSREKPGAGLLHLVGLTISTAETQKDALAARARLDLF